MGGHYHTLFEAVNKAITYLTDDCKRPPTLVVWRLNFDLTGGVQFIKKTSGFSRIEFHFQPTFGTSLLRPKLKPHATKVGGLYQGL